MLRNKNLVPLSHQHQHALALCVRIDRAVQAGNVDLRSWQLEIRQIFEQEISIHFDAEEKLLFPPAARFSELRDLTQELLREHGQLRDYFAQAAANTLDTGQLHAFASRLAAHIRKEERQLFERMQQLMPAIELKALGEALEKVLASAAPTCALTPGAARQWPGNHTK